VAAQGGMPTLRPLLRQLRTLNKSLAYGRQEDTHEFFYSLVNTMEAILLKEAGGKERFSLRWVLPPFPPAHLWSSFSTSCAALAGKGQQGAGGGGRRWLGVSRFHLPHCISGAGVVAEPVGLLPAGTAPSCTHTLGCVLCLMLPLAGP
jgi:hypothetical protein